MDIWSRLIGGAGNASKKRVNLNIPQQRLGNFKAAYSDLLQLWHNGDDVSTDAITAESIRIRLCRLLELLNDDTRGPTPHLCITFAATSRILVTVTTIAATFLYDGIIHETLEICSLLIDCEEEDFLEDHGFANALSKLLNSVVSSGPLAGDIETESLIVEVLFSIASRTRLEPKILPAWFRPKNPNDMSDVAVNRQHNPENASRKEDFPLFYLLLHHVPYQARAGEFARMGVLYIIELASRSEDLERWIVEGDMATLVASGLGALYSQLSRNLVLSYTKDEEPPILTYSDSRRIRPSSDAEETTSHGYQTHLTTFLSYLVFWQDLLENCASNDIKQTLLDHFQVLYLQQLLYPSLLESSGVDGGSSVAVLTYLRHILESIEYPELVRSILEYLLGSTKEPSEAKSTLRPATLARRRKSEQLLETYALLEQTSSPGLFTLVDLITTSLRGESQQTISATLQLSSVLLRKHHQYASSALVKTKTINDGARSRFFPDYERDIDSLLSLAENISNDYSLESSYERYLHDNRILLEHHSCSAPLLAISPIPSTGDTMRNLHSSFSGSSRSEVMIFRTIIKDDPFLLCLLNLIKKFFFNDVETNLSLTQTVVDLASCGLVCLEGWLITESVSPSAGSAFGTSKDVEKPILDGAIKPPSEAIEDDEKPHHAQAQSYPLRNVDNESQLFTIIHKLVDDVSSFQRDIHDFSKFIHEQKQLLENAVDHEAHANVPSERSRKSQDSTSSTTRLGQATEQATLVPSRSPSEKPSDDSSRFNSPRGRQQTTSTPPTLVSRLNHLHTSPSRSPSQSTSRNYSPSPLRNNSLTTTLPQSVEIPDERSTTMQRKIKIVNVDRAYPMSTLLSESTSSETSSVRSSSASAETRNDDIAEISLGQLITNVIILQEFILELTAVISVRATLFDEVRFE